MRLIVGSGLQIDLKTGHGLTNLDRPCSSSNGSMTSSRSPNALLHLTINHKPAHRRSGPSIPLSALDHHAFPTPARSQFLVPTVSNIRGSSFLVRAPASRNFHVLLVGFVFPLLTSFGTREIGQDYSRRKHHLCEWFWFQFLGCLCEFFYSKLC